MVSQAFYALTIKLFLFVSHDDVFQDQSKPYDSKKDCWIPDAEEGFISAQIKSTKGDTISVVTSRGNEVIYNRRSELNLSNNLRLLESDIVKPFSSCSVFCSEIFFNEIMICNC